MITTAQPQSVDPAMMQQPAALKIHGLALALICCLIAQLTANGQLYGEDGYRPSDHPATIIRSITAFTRPAAHLTIGAEDAARLVDLPVQAGMTISAEGDQAVVTVAQLDDRLSRAQLLASSAALQEAKARQQQVQADIARAKREQSWLQSELQRMQSLVKDGRSTQREVDELSYRYDAATLNLQSLQQQSLGAEAGVSAAAARLEQQQLILERHQLKAPVGWTVVKRLLEPGALVTPGQGILELAKVSELELELRLSSAELAALEAQQQRAGMLVLEHQGQVISAQLHAIDPNFDPISRKHMIWLRLAGEQLSAPRGGLEMSINIELPDPSGGLLIPFTYAKAELDQWLVYDRAGNWRTVTALRLLADALVIDSASIDPELTLSVPQRVELEEDAAQGDRP